MFNRSYFGGHLLALDFFQELRILRVTEILSLRKVSSVASEPPAVLSGSLQVHLARPSAANKFFRLFIKVLKFQFPL